MRSITRIQGTVVTVLLCDQPGRLASRRKDWIQVELAGLPGDRHYGHTFPSNARYPYPRGTEIRNSRQITIVSQEELEEIAADLSIPVIQPEWLGANLLVSGVPAFTKVPPASRLHFANGVVLVIQGDNAPCTLSGDVLQSNYPHIPKLSQAFVKAAHLKRGVVAWVEKPGRIHMGEVFEAEIVEQFDYISYLDPG
jgi:hypothetical protein